MQRQYLRKVRRPIAFAALLSVVALSADSHGDDAAGIPFERPSHFIVENQAVTVELSSTPLPMVDWGYVLAGHVDYVDRKTKRKLPLNDAHDIEDPLDVLAMRRCVPFGVRLRAQPATKGGTFATELFAPEFPWEENCTVHTLLFDEQERKYKLWYRSKGFFAFAESSDFKTWDRPMTSAVPQAGHPRTNILGVLNREELAHSPLRNPEEAKLGYAGAFFVDPSADKNERYKCTFLAHLKDHTDSHARQTHREISAMTGPGSTVLFGAVSRDGVGWRVLPEPILLHDADTLTVATFDPIHRVYRMYTRLYQHNRRTVGFSETSDFNHWPLPKNILVPGPDESPSTDYYATAFAHYPGTAKLQTMLCTVYDRANDRSEIRLAISRDGHSFHFPPGPPVIAPNAQVREESGFVAAFPGLVKTPDGRMLFFHDVHRTPHKFPRHRFGGSKHFAAGWQADRLVAIEAVEQGEFTLAPARLLGSQILLNFLTDRTGKIEAELRDDQFQPIPGRTFADCDPLVGNETAFPVQWRHRADLKDLKGQTLYVSFRMTAAKLFSVGSNGD
ncbi:MAG: hypothetical protein U1D30_25260 [Planctomycetota bacterium]